MKRSKSLSLLLMGTVALGVTACDNDDGRTQESMNVYSTVGECAKSGEFTQAQCDEFFQQAMAETPKFSSQQECEARFGEGACQGAPVQGAGMTSMWMPLMMGFMAGHFLSSGRMMAGGQGLYGNPNAAGSATAGTRNYRTSAGHPVNASAGGRVMGASPQVMQSMQHNARPAMGRSGAGARGGFSGGAVGGGS